MITIPPVFQLCTDLTRTGRWQFLDLFETAPTHASLRQFEESLARDSVLATSARQFYRTLLMRSLGQGNEKIILGRDGFLFYAQEVEMAAGPGILSRHASKVRGTDSRVRQNRTDPVQAIVDFDRQLRSAGIHLVFMPLPVKPFIYPEQVWSGYPAAAGPAWNSDRGALKDNLAAVGVDVLDITDDLWKAKSRLAENLFLKLDTHWTPLGLAVAADRLAEHVRPFLPRSGDLLLAARRQKVTNYGDLLRILEIAPSSGVFEPQTVEIVQILKGNELASGDNSSPILLLGDSFTNIYRRKEMEWGVGAGLGEQLMLRLGAGVQVIAINGGGATAVRETLAQKPSTLDRKKVVVWACSARDLYDESIAWEPVVIRKTY